MNLYLLKQYTNDNYDTYDSCVVCAESPKEAKLIHPSGHYRTTFKSEVDIDSFNAREDWAFIDEIECKLIGKAKEGIKKGVVISSFRAR
jgi:hypothetical protein